MKSRYLVVGTHQTPSSNVNRCSMNQRLKLEREREGKCGELMCRQKPDWVCPPCACVSERHVAESLVLDTVLCYQGYFSPFFFLFF